MVPPTVTVMKCERNEMILKAYWHMYVYLPHMEASLSKGPGMGMAWSIEISKATEIKVKFRSQQSESKNVYLTMVSNEGQ